MPNPSGGALTYQTPNDPNSDDNFEVPHDWAYPYTPSSETAHAAAFDPEGNGVTQQYKTYTVIVTDSQGNQTPVTVKVPVVPQNDNPEEVTPTVDPVTGDPVKPPTNVNGVIHGKLYLKDGDGDPLQVIGNAGDYGQVTVGDPELTPQQVSRLSSTP